MSTKHLKEKDSASKFIFLANYFPLKGRKKYLQTYKIREIHQEDRSREHYKEQWHWNCIEKLKEKVAMISNRDRVSDIESD